MLSQAILTPLSAPGSIYAAPLARVKDQLGYTDSSKDAELRAWIRTVSRAMAGTHGLKREFARRQWRVELPGLGGIFLPLPVHPIESVAAVTEDGATVDPTSYSIAEPDRLYRAAGWRRSDGAPALQAAGGGERLDYGVTCIAGWLMPEEAPEWSAAAAKAAGARVRPTSPSLFTFQASGAGTTGATEPTWPTTLGDTVDDNDITWTAVAAKVLPEDLEDAAIVTVIEWHRGGLELPVGLQRERLGSDLEIDYDFVGARHGVNPFPPAARALMAAYR